MKYTVRTLQKYHIAYALLPYKRNQDVITVHYQRGDLRFAASIVDGWNWKEKLDDDRTGRDAAQFIADTYPRRFLEYLKKNQYRLAAANAAKSIDQQVLAMYPKYVSAVATFLLSFMHVDIIVYVGKGIVLVHNGTHWEKPREIGDYFLDETTFGFPNEVSRFFGRGELKDDPLYSCLPDVVMLPSGIPVLLASDGIEDVFYEKELRQILQLDPAASPTSIVERLCAEITRRGTQRDDISLLLRL